MTGLIFFGRGGLKALLFPLFHELVVFRGARTGRRIRGQATGPLRDHVAQSGGEVAVDGSAATEPARHERDGNHDCNMANADGHLRSAATYEMTRTPVRPE